MAVRWEDREGPLLAALAEYEDSGGDPHVGAVTIGPLAGVDEDQALRGLIRLVESGFVHGNVMRSYGADDVMVSGLTERGLVRVGLWPDPNASPLEALLQVLDRMEADEHDEEKKGALARIRSAIGSAPRELSTALLIAYAKHVAHLGG